MGTEIITTFSDSTRWQMPNTNVLSIAPVRFKATDHGFLVDAQRTNLRQLVLTIADSIAVFSWMALIPDSLATKWVPLIRQSLLTVAWRGCRPDDLFAGLGFQLDTTGTNLRYVGATTGGFLLSTTERSMVDTTAPAGQYLQVGMGLQEGRVINPQPLTDRMLRNLPQYNAVQIVNSDTIQLGGLNGARVQMRAIRKNQPSNLSEVMIEGVILVQDNYTYYFIYEWLPTDESGQQALRRCVNSIRWVE
jgi:hypothetical protein